MIIILVVESIISLPTISDYKHMITRAQKNETDDDSKPRTEYSRVTSVMRVPDRPSFILKATCASDGKIPLKRFQAPVEPVILCMQGHKVEPLQNGEAN